MNANFPKPTIFVQCRVISLAKSNVSLSKSSFFYTTLFINPNFSAFYADRFYPVTNHSKDFLVDCIDLNIEIPGVVQNRPIDIPGQLN